MRLSSCLYVGLSFAACGSVHLKEMDGDPSSRGDVDTGAAIDVDTGVDVSANATDMRVALIDASIDTAMDASIDNTQSIDATDAQSTNNCSTCHLNCVSSLYTNGDPRGFTLCNGCVSNCPVNGIKLLCTCYEGCGYVPAEGTCNPVGN